MQNIDDAKKIMEEGWKARESFDFEKAEQLLLEAKQLFEEAQDWFNVTECLNHLAYTQKLKAQQLQKHGLDLVNESLDISKTKGTKDTLILRALISLLDVSGKYEEALKYAKIAVEKYDKPSSKSDILCHIATFELRTGKIDLAEKTIEEAIDLMNLGWESEIDPFRSIWKVRILLTKGLIVYNQGLVEEAIKLGNEALEIAKEKDLKTRLTQCEDFLKTVGGDKNEY